MIQFLVSVGFQPEPSLPQRLAQPLDTDFHDVLVNARFDSIQGFAVVGQLQDMGLEAAILGDNIGDSAEINHPLAQEKFQAKQRFRADNCRSGILIWVHCFGHTIHRPKRLRTLLRVHHFGDSQPVIAIHHNNFSPGDDAVSQQQFRWVLNVLV